MGAVAERAKQIATQAVRDVLCVASGAAQLQSDFYGKIGRKGVISARVASGLTGKAARALGQFCEVPPPPKPPPLDPGVVGGQCQIGYRVSLVCAYDDFPSGPGGETYVDRNLIQTLPGPLKTGRVNRTGAPGTNAPQVMQVVTESGTFDVFTFRDSSRIYKNPRLVDIVPAGSASDTCGDRPPSPPGVPPGAPPPVRPPIDEPVTPPGGSPVNVTFSPIVGIAFINANAEINVPVTVNVDLPDLNVNVDLNFDVNISNPDAPPTPRDPGDRPPGPDGRPSPDDCSPGPECQPEIEEDDEIDEEKAAFDHVGVRVELAETGQEGRTTRIFQAKGPTVMAPRAATLRVKLGVSATDPNGIWTEDIAVKGVQQVWVNPLPGYLYILDSAVTPERGFAVSSVKYMFIRPPRCC